MAVVIGVKEGEEVRLKLKPSGMPCPNLAIDDAGEATCGVHEEPWYRMTPCFTYGNPDLDPDFEPKRGKPCPVGEMFRKRKVNVLENAIAAAPLEDVGILEWEDGSVVSV